MPQTPRDPTPGAPFSKSSTRRRPAGEPKRAVAYLRVSTEGQDLGPEAQRAAIEAWARGAGVTIAAWCSDLGVSGAADLAERPGLQLALNTIAAERAGVLVVAKRDRLARDSLIALTLERDVARHGGRIVSADGVGNGSTPADEFMRSILDGAAAYERKLIAQRTSAALRAKRARGERPGEVPYGWSADPKGKLSPHPGELATMARARELRAQGLAQRAVVRELEDEGHRGRTGRPLRLAQVQRILAPSRDAHGGATAL